MFAARRVLENLEIVAFNTFAPAGLHKIWHSSFFSMFAARRVVQSLEIVIFQNFAARRALQRLQIWTSENVCCTQVCKMGKL